MRAITLALVLMLMAALALPVMAADYANPAPAETPADTYTPATEASPTLNPSMETPVPAPATVVTSSNDPLVISTITQFYRIDPATVSRLQARGYTAGDFAMLGNISVRTGKPISEVSDLRAQGMSWDDIGRRYNVASADMMMAPMGMMVTPMMRQGPVAGVTQEVIVGRPAPIVDRDGQIILTERQAHGFMRQGYSWRDIAVAANISRETGMSVSDVLTMTTRGLTWDVICRDLGLDPREMKDISYYPYSKERVKYHRDMYMNSSMSY
jgi:hypothetical protein